MMARNAAQAPWVLVLVALAALAAGGRGLSRAQASRNATASSANGETLDALLSTTSRACATSEYIESIRIMKHGFGFPTWSPEIKISFPPDNCSIPPGAEAWCNCLRDNEPAGGIPSDYEGVSNTCRDQVLRAATTTRWTCVGACSVFTSTIFSRHRRTFCMRELCESKDGPYRYNSSHYYLRYGYNLVTNCPGECMREVSAGYCAKYRLTYGGWIWSEKFDFWERISRRQWRNIAVDGIYVTERQLGTFEYWAYWKVSVAEKMCDALYPNDQGRCCTYQRGYATLSQCCYVKDGALEFNCGKAYGGDRLRYNCVHVHSYYPPGVWDISMPEGCNLLIDYYVAHPTYQQAKLAKLPGGQTSVVFPEAFIDDFCSSSERIGALPNYDSPYRSDRENCCNRMRIFFRYFVKNCQPGAGSYPSLGATRLPPSVAGAPPTPPPTPPPTSCDACSYMDENGDCESACKNSQECTARKGKAFCVQCNYFRQDFPDGKNRQCCELRDGDSGTFCKTKANSKGEKNKCFTNEGPWTTNNGKSRNPQPYTIKAVQNVCNEKDNFRVNRKLCKVKDTANGRKKCKYIGEKTRDRILAGR